MERRGVSASRACSLPVVSKTRMGNCGAVLGGMGDAGSAGAGNVVDGTTVAVAPLVSVGSWWVGLWVDKWGEWGWDGLTNEVQAALALEVGLFVGLIHGHADDLGIELVVLVYGEWGG